MIGKAGIRHEGLHYIAPEIHGRGGQRIQIRYMPHDDRFIEVYLGDKHLCTAYPTGALTEAQTEAYRAHARAEAKKLGAARRKASARVRRELAPMTSGQSPAESRLIPAERARRLTGRAADEALAARGKTNLLGIKPVTEITEEF